MDFKKTFVTNKKKEEEGVWQAGPDGSKFLIARAGNAKFTQLAGKLMKPYRKLIQMGKADDKVISEIAAEITSRTILLDWDGFKDGDVVVPYSIEEAKKRLLEASDFADFIAGLSQQVSEYQDEEQEAATKN
jgi:hypothetical protein